MTTKYKPGTHPNSHIGNHGGGYRYKKGHIVPQETINLIRQKVLGQKRHVTPHNEVTKLKISLNKIGCIPWNKGKKIGPQSEETKLKSRLSRIEYIKKQYISHGITWPVIGKFEKIILNNFKKCINYPIISQYEFRGFFIDGYCSALNLAIEIDEPYHNSRKQNDEERQMEIQKYLKCEFLRIPISNYIYNNYKGD